MSDATKWDDRYRDSVVTNAAPSRVLAEFAHLLPAQGEALDLACGMGGNALFLARRHLATSAWDISAVAVDKLKAEARRRGLELAANVRDVVENPPEPDRFDVIVVSRFLERELMPAIVASLRPRGLLFYQTFIRERVNDTGPSNDAYRLGNNELLRLRGGLRVLVYREEGRVGDPQLGFRNEAMLVGQREI